MLQNFKNPSTFLIPAGIKKNLKILPTSLDTLKGWNKNPKSAPLDAVFLFE